jgi:surfeit locus 1 family protein
MSAVGTGRVRFRLRPAWLVAAVAGCALFVALGNWQTRRAHEKLDAQARLDALASAAPAKLPSALVKAAEFAGRRVTVRGEYVPKQTVLIDNRVHKGVAGFHVVTPLRIEDGAVHVLVNRGWVAARPRHDELPAIATPVGVQTVDGIAVVPSGRIYELAPDTTRGPVRQNLVIGRIAAETGLALQPLVIEQTNDAGDGLVRAWPRPDAGADTNRAYAVQWYALALLTVVVYIALGFERVGSAA